MDLQLERLINGAWTSPALDRLMAIMSSLDVWLPLIVVVVLLSLWRGKARARWFLATLALTLTLSDGLATQTLKRIAHRARPYQAVEGIREIDLARHVSPHFLAAFRPLDIRVSAPTPEETAAAERSEGRSFPSGHTMNNFCAATLLAFFYRRWGWLYFIPAALVGYSRIDVGAHWPSDVLATAMLAFAFSCAMLALSDLARRRLAAYDPRPA